tara:strand:- start:11810 stop:12748 length:939 start_codon:yes stop_codon:yes gene_type:complete
MAKKKIPQIVKDIRAYQPPPIDWDNQKITSYSQMSMFNDCPKKWSLQYKEGFKQFTSSIHTVFGTAIHEALQKYLTTMYNESKVKADRYPIYPFFKTALLDEYKKQVKINKGIHFCTSKELRDAHEDGVNIIRDFSKNVTKHFSKRGWWLVGCEIPLSVIPHSDHPEVRYEAYLDVVLYHEHTNSLLILDLKTSTWGWKDKEKKNENKQFQLILYKKYFAEKFNFPIENIEIEFFILKRKLYESEDFVIKRIQKFRPPSGKIKLKKATTSLENFVDTCFEGSKFKEVEHQPTENMYCNWCPFYKTHLCTATF